MFCRLEPKCTKSSLRTCLLGIVLLFACVVSVRSVEASSSTIWGGSLLDEGEVALTVGGGFPDVFFQFDFANSRSFNFALRANLNYNYGFPFFGVYGSLSAPIRIGILQPPSFKIKDGRAFPPKEIPPLSLSIHVTPGLLLVGLSPDIHQYTFGVSLGLGVMFSYRILPRLHIIFGLDFPMSLTIEPNNARAVLMGFNLPIEAVGGIEFALNAHLTFFGRVAIGPMIYFGQMAGNFSVDDIAVSGSGRLWLGISWRR